MIAILILAHRGTGKGKNENSLNAFIRGLDRGAKGIELDIRKTKDDYPVCVHDESLLRVFDRDIRIQDLTLEDLKSQNLLNEDDITTLEDVFKNVGTGIYYDIEIKDPAVLEEFHKLVEKYRPADLMVSSFRHHCLNDVRRIIPNALIAPLIDFRGVEDYKTYIREIVSEYEPDFLNLDVRFFNESNEEKIEWFSKLKQEHKVNLAFWTVNDLESYGLIKNICDVLITDVPHIFFKQL